jgi:glycosyltransferase involved in cell wall biosynthesis
VTSSVAAARAGVHTTVAAIDERPGDRDAVHRLRAEQIDVVRFALGRPRRAAGRWAISWALAGHLFRSRFDVVHAHGAWTFTTAVALVLAKLRRRVAVLTPHESLTDFDIAKARPVERVVKRLLRRLYLNAFDAVVFASRLEERASAHAGTRTRTLVIPHGLERRAPVAAPRRANGLRVGYLGRLDPKKNVDLLIRALPAGATLRVAGDGPPTLRTDLERTAESTPEVRVEWLGFVRGDGKDSFLASVDVLALPSAFEGFGLAAAEALCAGVPVVVSRTTGIAPIVEQYGCGAVVDASEESLRAAFSDPTRFDRDRERAVLAAQHEFGLEPHGRRLAALYRDLVGSR